MQSGLFAHGGGTIEIRMQGHWEETMTQLLDTNERLFRYLLGDLPEAEREALEAEYFSSPALIDHLDAVEIDLIEGYVNNKLTVADRLRFESVWLNSPQRREKLALFQTLSLTLPLEQAASPVAVKTKPISWRQAIFAGWTMPRWVFGAVLPAMMLGVAWLGWENLRWREHAKRIEQERATLERRERELQTQLAAQTQNNHQLSAELDALQQRLAAMPQPSAPAIVSFAWTLTGLRQASGEGEARKLTIPANADAVQLTFNLATDRYRKYQLDLLAADRQTVWQSANLNVVNRRVIARIPAQRLQPATYRIILSAVGPNGDLIETGLFNIEIIRR